MITNKTRLNMVIGYPLNHTQSPLLHNTIYQSLGIDAVLLAFPHMKVESLIHAIKTLAIELTAVTMPFKEDVLKYIDDCASDAKTLKAVNTIVQREGKLFGYNTDVHGIAYAFRDSDVVNKRVLIIGAGGAARAAGYFMQKNNAELFWLNRSREKAINLSNDFGGKVLDHVNQLGEISIDIIINTTSLGMYPDVSSSPLVGYSFKPHQIVFDLVYNPVETQFLKSALKSGAKIISGREMFIGQGIRQIELWLGKSVFTKSITDSVIRALSLLPLAGEGARRADEG